jgi:competence protein ComEA
MKLPFASSTSVSAPGSSGASGAGPASVSSSSVPEGSEGSEVVVHVAGAVASPGVQELPAGSRVVDAVDAGGGALPEADLAKINLAAPLEDGQQVYVPRLGEPAGGAAVAAPGAGGGGAGAGDSSEIVDLNTADVSQLDALPGVGPAIAQAIVDHRESNGPFTSVDDLLDVRGIGEAKLADLRDRVTV